MNIGHLLDYVEEPRGDASKVMCFLAGGRYDGDKASIVPPTPDVLAVAPCDSSCRDPLTGKTCGMPTHWHDTVEGVFRGDVPRHAGYYVLVRTQPAASGMRAALYLSVGHESPTQSTVRAARENFDAQVRRAEDIASQISPEAPHE